LAERIVEKMKNALGRQDEGDLKKRAIWSPGHSLRAKLMCLFFLFFFIPYAVLTLFSVSASRGMMKQGTMHHLQNLVEVKETAIEQWLKDRIGDGKKITDSQEVKSLDPRRMRHLLSLVDQIDRTYLGIWVLDTKGQVIWGDPFTFSHQAGDWFQKAIEEGILISEPLFQPQILSPTLALYFSIKDGKENPIGVLKKLVDLAYISDLIAESKLGETGQFYLVTAQGEIVLHNRLGELLKKGAPRVSYFEKAEPQPTFTGVYKNPAGKEVLGSWKRIPYIGCYLIAEQDMEEAFAQIDRLLQRAFLLFSLSCLLILIISYGVIGRVTGPLQGLSETITSFAKGHFDKTGPTRRGDEIGRLISGFNLMAEKLTKAYAQLEGKVEASNKELETAYRMLKRRQEQLMRSEKMAALGKLSAGIAHEIRTPMTSIKLFIQSKEKELDLDENQKEDFRIIMKEIDRINENIIRFLNFARPEEPILQPVKVSALAKEAVRLLAGKLRNSGINLHISLADEDTPVPADPKQLTQVLLNLLINAIEAMPQGGTLTIHSAVEEPPDTLQQFLRLVIKDTGQGIPEKDRPYLFDPFFTTKAGGTGLGLSIAYSILQKHNGRLEVESQLGKGSSFIVSLPVQGEGSWKEFL